MAVRSAYLGSVLTPKGLIKRANSLASALRPYEKKFDAIAFRGVSGSLVGPMVAANLNKHMLVVRKVQAESSHSYLEVEGEADTKRYVIVDDLISSGRTIKSIIDSIAKEISPTVVCAGLGLYLQSELSFACYQEEVQAATAQHCDKEFFSVLIPQD